MFEEDYKVDNDTEETPNKEKRKKISTTEPKDFEYKTTIEFKE